MRNEPTGHLAPKAKVLRCHQPVPYTAASKGVVHQWGGVGMSVEGWHVSGVGVVHQGVALSVGSLGGVDFGLYLVGGWHPWGVS